MKKLSMFRKIYDSVIIWSRHRYAVYYLCVVSFFESFIFPVPTVVMLLPMMLASYKNTYYLAFIACVSSVLGGCVGYLIGWLFFDQFGLLIIDMLDAHEQYEQVTLWFQEYGMWLVLLAGATPIPYKLITISSGALALSFPLFFVFSFLGRGIQFFSLGFVIRWKGERMHSFITKWVEWIGYIVVFSVIMFFLFR